LEELLKGRVKKITVSADDTTEQKTFTVNIEPGFKSGTKIKFPASDDFARPVEFEIEEVPHKHFKRLSNKKSTGNKRNGRPGIDLLWKCRLTERQIEKGVTIQVPLIEGKSLSIESKDYNIFPGARITLPGYGMPINSKDPRKRGNLIVEFEIKQGSTRGN
jgi:DnaJ family protein B protein 4